MWLHGAACLMSFSGKGPDEAPMHHGEKGLDFAVHCSLTSLCGFLHARTKRCLQAGEERQPDDA
jgi:hypothetical protein